MDPIGGVLVFGPRKSGTTLLQTLLDGGQTMLVLPGELKLKTLACAVALSPSDYTRFYLQAGRSDFAPLYGRKRRIRISKSYARKGPIERLPPLSPEEKLLKASSDFTFRGLTRSQTLDQFDVSCYVENLRTLLASPPSSPSLTLQADVMAFAKCVRSNHESSDNHIANSNYARWAVKEVGGSPKTVINFFRSMVARGKVVLLVREPAYVARSVVLRQRRAGQRMSFKQVFQECQDAQNFIDYACSTSHKEDEDTVLISYEQLTGDTQGQMGRVAGALKIPFEPIFCTPTVLGVPTIVPTSSRDTQAIFQQVPDWKKDLLPDQRLSIACFQRIAPFLARREGRTFTPYPMLMSALQELK